MFGPGNWGSTVSFSTAPFFKALPKKMGYGANRDTVVQEARDVVGYKLFAIATLNINGIGSKTSTGEECSVDQQTWSDIHMLDPLRPFRDDATSFYPVGIVNGTFPLTDETGMPSGLYFSLNRAFTSDYTLLISTSAAASYGAQASLEVDLDKPSYCNTLAINASQSSGQRTDASQRSGERRDQCVLRAAMPSGAACHA